MSVRFYLQSPPLRAVHQSPDSPVVQPKKTGVFARVMRMGHGVVAGGRQLRGVLMRLVNAKGASAVRGLTSPVKAASTTFSLGSGYPRGGNGSSSPIGLGIMRIPSDGQQAPTPSTHLENARKNLKLSLLHSRSHHDRLESPVPAQSEEIADVEKHRSTTLSAKDFKRSRGPLESVNELPGSSSGTNEVDQIRKVIGPSGVRCANGKRYMVERDTVDDPHSTQVLSNKLNALRRIRGLKGIAWVEAFENLRGQEKFSLLKHMGDTPLMNILHNDKTYRFKFTIRQMARLLHGIHSMHQCGVIHRKVSSENIMTGDADGNFTLFNFNSCVVTKTGAMIDGDIPLWVHDEILGPEGDPKRRAHSPYYDDYVALGHIWHEMRTRFLPIDIGNGKFKLKDELLNTDEMLFIRRLLSTDDDYRFNSVEEMKKHAIFKHIDWRELE